MTHEKEAHEIVKVFGKMYYILWGPNQVITYSDHKYLLYAFSPLTLRLHAPKYVLSIVHQ